MPKSIEEILTDVIKAEGPETNDSTDRGGRTAFGISEKSNPVAWSDGRVTEEEARAIYERKYVISPGFDKIGDSKLKEQLIDFGVNSGPQLAIMGLQRVLNITADGLLGPKTLAVLDANTYRVRIISNQLAIARIKMFGRIVKKDPSQLKYLNGWLNRACEWII